MTKEPTPDQTIDMLLCERDSLLDTVEALRWMVDQMNKDSETMVHDMETHGPVYAAVAYTFGPRCDDYDPGCPGCSAWAEHDEITALSAESERLRAALERAVNFFRESRVAHHTTRAVHGDIPSAQIAILADMDTAVFRAALEEAPQGRISEAAAQPATGKEDQ